MAAAEFTVRANPPVSDRRPVAAAVVSIFLLMMDRIPLFLWNKGEAGGDPPLLRPALPTPSDCVGMA
ncbi:hypothetical protein GCM10017752_24770 [Streptomyces roseoviridis]